jgi:tetratricopeptide (TPR) repeat protein
LTLAKRVAYDRQVRWLLALSMLLVATPILAAPATPGEVTAKQHYEAGTTAFNLGDFQKAVVEYKAAYQLRQDPVFLYNIAQAYRLANDLPNALFFYRSYLSNSPGAPNRKEVEGRIEALDKEVRHQRETATAPPNSPAMPSGEQTAGRPPATEPPASVASTPPARSEAEATPVYKKWWLWTAVGGVVVVGVALGVGLGVGLSGGGEPSSHFGTSEFFLVPR